MFALDSGAHQLGRRAAGNVSHTLVIVVPRMLVTSTDKAIALEERAEDLLDANRLDEARANLLQSIPLIDQSFGAAVKRLAATQGKNLDEAHVVITLAKVRAAKSNAIALMKPKTVALANQSLQQALQLELELAAWAAGKGIGL